MSDVPHAQRSVWHVSRVAGTGYQPFRQPERYGRERRWERHAALILFMFSNIASSHHVVKMF
jgi:hypothetical protein